MSASKDQFFDRHTQDFELEIEIFIFYFKI